MGKRSERSLSPTTALCSAPRMRGKRDWGPTPSMFKVGAFRAFHSEMGIPRPGLPEESRQDGQGSPQELPALPPAEGQRWPHRALHLLGSPSTSLQGWKQKPVENVRQSDVSAGCQAHSAQQQQQEAVKGRAALGRVSLGSAHPRLRPIPRGHAGLRGSGWHSQHWTLRGHLTLLRELGLPTHQTEN